MQDTVRCPLCGKSLKVPREAAGRRISCASCNHKFELPGKVDLTESTTGEIPILRTAPARDTTLSRSMLPGPMASVVPPDEMLGRLEPGSLRWLFATSALESFLGQTIEQLNRRSFPEFLHPDDRSLAEDEIRKAVELGERHDFVLRFPGPSKRIRYVRVYTQARYNSDGSINHIRCYLKDVTERVQAEQELRRRTEQLTATNEQLRQSNQKLKEAQVQLVHSEKLASLGTLAAGMAHEINNPLAFAMNNVSVLGREVGDLLRLVGLYQEGWDVVREARPELAERIEQLEGDADLAYLRENLPRMTESTRQGLQRVARIVENLRGFAQLDRSVVAEVDINQALDQSIAMLADSLAQQHILVDRQYETLPPLECAAAPLNQVFLNLLLNAFQAVQATGRETGRIRVSTRFADGHIAVEVVDDGCGIPPEVIPKVFDPFFTTKPIGRGTGLGLSISHGIIAEHGGRIEVRSAVGQGSRFRVVLPIDRAAGRPAPPQSPLPTPP